MAVLVLASESAEKETGKNFGRLFLRAAEPQSPLRISSTSLTRWLLPLAHKFRDFTAIRGLIIPARSLRSKKSGIPHFARNDTTAVFTGPN
ncbi:MAG: hypothetical protein ACYDC3_14075 [Candidatus Binataceae bacterium]